MADEKAKKPVNVHERLSGSLAKFKQNMEKIREVTNATEGVQGIEEQKDKDKK